MITDSIRNNMTAPVTAGPLSPEAAQLVLGSAGEPMTDAQRDVNPAGRAWGTTAGTTAHSVTARKTYRCDDGTATAGPGYDGCTHTIEPGQVYARHVVFPNAEFHNGERPRVIRLCEPCQIQHGHIMPPPRGPLP